MNPARRLGLLSAPLALASVLASCGGSGGGSPPPVRQEALLSLGAAAVTSSSSGTFVDIPLSLTPGAGAGVLLQADLTCDGALLRAVEQPVTASQSVATADGDRQGPGAVRIVVGDGQTAAGQPLQEGPLATVRFEVLQTSSGTQTAVTVAAIQLVDADGAALPVEGVGASATVTLP